MNPTRATFILLLTLLCLWGCGAPPPAQPMSSPSRSSNQAERLSSETQRSDDDVEVIDEETSVDRDDDDDDEDEEDDRDEEDEKEDGDRSTLVITATETQVENVSISIRRSGDDWQDYPWPDDGKTIRIDDFCSRGDVTRIEVRALTEDGAIVSMPHDDLAVLSDSTTSIKIGYEPTGCDGDLCQDDNVVTLTCGDDEIRIID